MRVAKKCGSRSLSRELKIAIRICCINSSNNLVRCGNTITKKIIRENGLNSRMIMLREIFGLTQDEDGGQWTVIGEDHYRKTPNAMARCKHKGLRVIPHDLVGVRTGRGKQWIEMYRGLAVRWNGV